MSTIKPLDVYIGDVKVFPDINLDILKYFGTSPVLSDMADWGETFFLYHRCDINNLAMNFVASQSTPLLLPVIDDSDAAMSTNVFHKFGANLQPGVYATSTVKNFWNFDSLEHYLWDIPFALNAGWLAYNTQYGGGAGNFARCEEISSLTFCGSATPYILKDDQGNIVLKTEGNFRDMFSYCHKLTSITGLVINNVDNYVYDSAYLQDDATIIEANGRWGDNYGSWNSDHANIGYSWMFIDCGNLTTLDITWPTTMHSDNFSSMFYGCSSLPDNQFPTINGVPLTSGHTLSFENAFFYCNNLAHVPISASTWQYIDNISSMCYATKVQSIDVPATATNLHYITNVLGDHPEPTRNPITQEAITYANNRYIIRTTAPLTFLLTQDPETGEYPDPATCNLFNFAEYENDSLFQSTFGGLYVPDSQLSDWANYLENTLLAPTFVQNHLHGVSDLNE